MTDIRLPEWRTIGDLLSAKARQHGNATFVEVAGHALTYSELDRRASAFARGLRAMGVKKGDRVATFMFNAPEQLVCFFGITRLAAIWTPVNAGLVGRDLSHTLSDSGSRILVTDGENEEKVAALPAELLDQIEVFSTDRSSSARPFSEIEEAGTDAEDLPQVQGSDAAVILYTGGTTGLPKGVVLSQLSFVLSGVRYGDSFEVKPGERHFTTLPLFHAAALQFAIMGPLVNDMSSVIDRRFSASGYWSRVRETRANIIDPIGSMLVMLCDQLKEPEDTAHALRVCIGISGQIPPEVPEQFSSRFNVPMVSIYGLTEGGGAMLTSNRLQQQAKGSVGRPHGWVELRIAGEDDQPLAPGDVGEILLRPNYPHMFMLRYHGNPEKTLENFSNLWFHTGDLGRVDDEGNLYFVGRMAHWMRRRGENISAYEIEETIRDIPGVTEVVVVGVPSELGEDDVKAFIIAEPGNRPTPEIIISFCQDRIAAFKVPRYIEFVDEFPRSVTKQEVERHVLKKLPNDSAWDREREMGRLSWQSTR